MKKNILLGLLSVISLTAWAQNIEIEPSISPEFFAADQEIEISYDVTTNTISSWDEAWIWFWTPENSNSNVISNINPANSDEAKTAAAKLTKSTIDGRVYFTIKLTPTAFTGLSKEEISSIGMLIKGNDWSDGQSTDYITNVTNEFTVLFSNPTGTFDFYEEGAIIAADIRVSAPADISLYVDDILLASAQNVSQLTFDHAIISDGKTHQLKAVASTGNENDEVIYTYSLAPDPVELAVPAGAIDGVNYLADETQATLVLTAPNKSHIYILGDFNEWTIGEEYLMNTDGDKHWRTIENLVPKKEYVFQYLVDGDIRVADPYTDKVSDPWDDQHIEEEVYPNLIAYPYAHTNHRASVLQTGQAPYEWQEESFVMPEKEDLVIYELLIRDFDDAHTYKSVIDRLDYLQDLGINALELMPVNEFEGNESWGYNPNFFFAPDKYYGTKNDLKSLIDACHARGIAVIIDMVLNHSFNSSPLARMYWNESANKPAADSPWYNENHNFQTSAAHWGADFNHESLYMQSLVDSVNSYWLDEYRVDGFRFDFTKGFGNKYKSQSSDEWGSKYDAERIALLKRMADQIWKVKPDAIVSFEHLAENSEEKELANYGILLWGNMNGSYIQLAKGSASSIDWIYHEERDWDEPNLVGYMESHDEERVVYEVMKSGVRSLEETLKRSQLNAAFFFLIPGPKMIWQFGEMGYDEELNNDRVGVKPTHWEYLEDENRFKLTETYRALANLKSQTGYIKSDYFTWSGTGSVKWMNIDHPEVKICVVGNFGTADQTTDAHLISNGTWYDYLSKEAIEVTDFENYEVSLSPGRFKILTSEVLDNYIDSNPFILNVDEQSIETELLVYPNPAKDLLTIETQGKINQLQIIDLLGKSYPSKINNSADHPLEISISSLRKGVYFLEIETNNTKIIRRFIKE